MLADVRAFIIFLALIAFACGSTTRRRRSGKKDETAAEYQRRKAREAGELDDEKSSKPWGGWKYQGARDDCRYVFGRACYAKQEAACKAAKCKTSCLVEGGGPAKVTCAKPKKKG
jgi:hypothetical protein